MTISCGIRVSLATLAALLLSESALAQSVAGDVFLQIFHVGSPEQSVGEATQGNFAGVVGSAGCGGGDGSQLQATLEESGFPDPTQTDVYRFCDAFTTSDAGWSDASALDAGRDAGAAVRRQQQGLAPDELFMQIDQAATLAGLQITNVTARIQAIRLARYGRARRDRDALAHGAGAPDRLEEGLAGGQMPGVGAPTFARALRRGFSIGEGLLGLDGLSGFVNGRYTRIDADDSANETGSAGNGGGLTLGVDQQLGGNAFLGLAFGYSHLGTDYDHGFGASDLDDYTFSLYGSVFPTEQLYLDGIVSGSILRFDQRRRVPSAVPGVMFETIESDPEGWNVAADLGIGGEIHASPFDLNPYLRVAVSHTEMDDFAERGSTLALSIDDQRNTSVTTTLGLSVSLPVSTSFGVVGPYLRGEYVHEYGDQADDLTGNMRLFSDGTGFRLEPTDTDRNYGRVGAGATLALPRGLSAFADYDVVVGFSNLVVHEVTIGGRLEF